MLVMINLILWEPFNFTIWNKCEDSYAKGPDKLVLRAYKQESIQEIRDHLQTQLIDDNLEKRRHKQFQNLNYKVTESIVMNMYCALGKLAERNIWDHSLNNIIALESHGI